MFYVGMLFSSWAVKEERSVTLTFSHPKNRTLIAAAEGHIISVIFFKASLDSFGTNILWIETIKPFIVSTFYLKDHCKVVVG